MGMESSLSLANGQSLGSDVHVRNSLAPAIVSSCTMGTPDTVIKAIPDNARFIEYYACMHDDLDLFFSHLSRPRSALRVFAESAGGDDEEGEANAAAFSQALRREFRGRDIIALASFIPEIMPPGALSPKAVAALKFLVMTAAKLKIADRSFVVEFVGGSRTRGLTKRVRRIKHGEGIWEDDRYRVGVLSSSELRSSIQDLIKRLEPVAVEAEERGILLALELEPGPFFLINSASALDLFCQELNSGSAQSWKNAIGLNLDVAHWAFLSKHPMPDSPKLDLSWLEKREYVLNRIVHAHISDQSIGHLGDLHLTAVHQDADFAPWLELIARRAARKPDVDHGVLPFSGFISIEHEACKTPEQIHYSFDILTKWVSQIACNSVQYPASAICDGRQSDVSP